jgi:N-acetylglucosamine kinase-like BadF-type ATPase
MMVVLAVDAGGTSTRVLVVDATGRCQALGRAGGGNPISSGVETATASLLQGARAALAAAGAADGDVELTLLAVAGAGSGAQRDALAARLAAGGFGGRFEFASDLLATYCSGTHLPAGYALIAGTGAAAIRVEHGRQAAVADGLGWLLGDAGSGFAIGRRVARAALADLDGRGPSTALTAALLERLAVPPGHGSRQTAESVTRALYAATPVRLADLAALAFAAAGDPVADSIVADAARALTTTLRAVRAADVAGPIVMGGGVLGHSTALRDAVLAAYAEGGAVPETRVVRDGAVGAAVLALRHVGVDVGERIFATLTTSVASHREPAGPVEDDAANGDRCHIQPPLPGR